MITPKFITTGFSVASQITPDDVQALKERGFRSIICNRPDGEAPGQPRFTVIEAAARNAGLAVRYVPVEAGRIREKDVAAFAAAIDELPGPVLAYCRTGQRSSRLWSLSETCRR